MPITRALLSVSDKTGLAAFAKELHDMGVELLSTGGTSAALREAGFAEDARLDDCVGRGTARGTAGADRRHRFRAGGCANGSGGGGAQAAR